MNKLEAKAIFTNAMGDGFKFVSYDILDFKPAQITSDVDVFFYDGLDLIDLKDYKDSDESLVDAIQRVIQEGNVEVVYVRKYFGCSKTNAGTPSNGIKVFL
ncbi:hypothetical protein FWF89_00430 [Candidatus Saccharibacteria bacterium]|nr:hypothetical protein [Candidatus Saccharibacteria bacterium]